MNRRSFLASMVAAGGSVALRRSALGQDRSPATRPSPSSPSEQAELIRTAASQFLGTLAPDRRGRVTFAFPAGQSPTAVGFGPMLGRPGGAEHRGHDVAFDADGHPLADAGPDGGHGPGGGPPHGGPDGPHHGGPPAAGEKYGQAVWTNFPVDIVARPGVRMGEFTAAEGAAVHGLLRAVLSPMGYQKVSDVMAADQLVADAGADYAAGLNVYTIGLFGEPTATAPWMLQFGGHHLGLNVTFVGDKAVCAPLHTGILPARFEADGKVVRGLGRENDRAFDLLATLTPGQLKAATIDHDVSDLVRGPGRPTASLPPEGLRGADMTADQRAILFELAREWVGVLNDAHAAQRLDDVRRALPDTRFAWSGPTTHEPGRNGEAYFRVHGPSLLIEHAPQRNQGGYKVHVHTVMRDLDNDYARRLV